MPKREELKKLIKCLRLLQTLDTEMQIPTILAFLELATWDKDKPPFQLP